MEVEVEVEVPEMQSLECEVEVEVASKAPKMPSMNVLQAAVTCGTGEVELNEVEVEVDVKAPKLDLDCELEVECDLNPVGSKEHITVGIDAAVSPGIDALPLRFEFHPGTLFSENLSDYSARYGCHMKQYLILNVKDHVGGSKWELPPVSRIKLMTLAKHALVESAKWRTHERQDSLRVADSAKWILNCKKLKTEVLEVVKNLNNIVRDPRITHLNHVAEFMGISPISESCSHGHGADHGGRSISFYSDHKRRTIREGYVVLANRNPRMVWCRRVCLWAAATAVILPVIILLTATQHSPEVDTLVVSEVIFAVLGGLICLILTACCNSPFCTHLPLCGVTSHFMVWLTVSSDSICFYYDHKKAVEGVAPEASIPILPGFDISPPVEGCWGCTTRCYWVCAQYEFRIITIDDEWTLSFSGALERDLWRKAITTAMQRQQLSRCPVRKFLSEAKPECEHKVGCLWCSARCGV